MLLLSDSEQSLYPLHIRFVNDPDVSQIPFLLLFYVHPLSMSFSQSVPKITFIRKSTYSSGCLRLSSPCLYPLSILILLPFIISLSFFAERSIILLSSEPTITRALISFMAGSGMKIAFSFSILERLSLLIWIAVP